MKSPQSRVLLFALLISVYLLVTARKSDVSPKNPLIDSDEFTSLKIYKSLFYHRFYDFRLTSSRDTHYLSTRFDSVKNSYFLSLVDIKKGDYELEIISEFDSVQRILLNLNNDTSFHLDSNLFVQYSSDQNNYNYFVKRMENKLPFNILFESNGCFADASIRYLINGDSIDSGRVRQFREGVFLNSFEVDNQDFLKKLKLIMSAKENPTKEQVVLIDSLGNKTIIRKMISSSSSTIHLENNGKIYSIWSEDMTSDKNRKLFYSLYNGFKYPKLQLKLDY